MKETTKKVLIVEDDGFISEVYITKITAEGFSVIMANDGEKALELTRSKNPDLILLDITIPKIDGIEFLKKIRSEEEVSDILVIVLTNSNEEEHLSQARELGVSEYLIKSHYTPSEVVLKIREVLN